MKSLSQQFRRSRTTNVEPISDGDDEEQQQTQPDFQQEIQHSHQKESSHLSPLLESNGIPSPKQNSLHGRFANHDSPPTRLLSDDSIARRAFSPRVQFHAPFGRSSNTMSRIRTVADFTRHTVDQYWIEKAFVCIEYLQLFSVIYAITISKWGWPIWWKSQVKWVVIFNLDIWTLMDGDVSVDYNVYAVIWAVLSLVPIFLYAAWNKYYRDYDSVDDQIFRSLLPRIVIAIGRVAYLPYLLSAMRLLECRNGYLVADSKTECYKSNFTFVHVFVLVVTIVCIVALVAQYIQVIQKLRSYRQGERYETILDSKEMEYHLRLTSTWASERFYLVNSYTYYGSVYPIVNFALKALLVLFLCLISDKVMQAWVCVLVLLVHLVCSMLPYRCISSNAFSFFMNGTITCYAIFGALLAGGVESPYLLLPLSRKILTAIHIIGVMIAWMSVAIALYFGGGWPLPRTAALSYERRNKAIVRTVQEALVMSSQLSSGALTFVNSEHLASLINRLSHYAEDESSHLSHLTHQVWFQLYTKYNRLRPMKDLPYENIVLVVEYQPLKEIIGDFKMRLDSRDFDLLLVDKRMKRILLKLLAVRAFIGSRYISYFDLNNPTVSRNLSSQFTSEFAGTSIIKSDPKKVRIIDEDSDDDGPTNEELQEIEDNIISYMDTVDDVIGQDQFGLVPLADVSRALESLDRVLPPGDPIRPSTVMQPSFRTPEYLLVRRSAKAE
eukprot:TRINITY_DN4878_c0_g1_i3.p1 TRINITY_DN4878_c0_g1~~TRINITY_DN4878_c0_g1_i3.p1  ORF type:complete len:723 (+),score=130.93 TRINITY_DN4878_c0_g1_i3:135-2303(+)